MSTDGKSGPIPRRNPETPATPKKPPVITSAGSIRGFERIFGQAQPDAAGQTNSVTIHLIRDTANPAYQKLIKNALARDDKTIRFASGALRVVVLPDDGKSANIGPAAQPTTESKSDAQS